MRPFKGLIKALKGLIRPALKGLIRPFRALYEEPRIITLLEEGGGSP